MIGVRQNRNALQQLRALASKFQMLGSNPRLRISRHEMPRKSSQFMINKSKCHTETWLESQKVRLSDSKCRGSRKHGCGFVENSPSRLRGAFETRKKFETERLKQG